MPNLATCTGPTLGQYWAWKSDFSCVLCVMHTVRSCARDPQTCGGKVTWNITWFYRFPLGVKWITSWKFKYLVLHRIRISFLSGKKSKKKFLFVLKACPLFISNCWFFLQRKNKITHGRYTKKCKSSRVYTTIIMYVREAASAKSLSRLLQ